MNLIKMSKHLQISRKNRILVEVIRFQERLFERMKQPDYPILEKVKMTRIIKGNIEEFCHFKLGRANATTLFNIQDCIEDLYREMGSYLESVIAEHDNKFIDYVMSEMNKRDPEPKRVMFRKKIKGENGKEDFKNMIAIFTDDEAKLGEPVSNELGVVIIKTPKIILDIDYLVNKVEGKYAPQSVEDLSFPPFNAREDVSSEELFKMYSFNNDVIFRTPYDSYEIILDFMEGCLKSSHYHTILMTLYRTADDSRIVDMLCAYADLYRRANSTKKIFVYVETTASGNEELNQRNIEKMSKSGVCVIYGSDYKVHAKMFIALGSRDVCAHFSTGNYNEKSAKIYTDIQLITRDKSKILPAVNVFYKFIWGKTMVSETLKPTNCIWFSPNDLKATLIGLFRSQIKLGPKGKIVLKVNSIADDEILGYIYEAIDAGCEVHIICRSICLIDPVYLYRPKVNVECYCGRFLEHDRIYGFGDRYFIASADLSFRNMHKRVESFIEMTDNSCRQCLEDVINNMSVENPYKFVMNHEGDWEIVPSSK